MTAILRGETIICSVTVRNAAGTKVDPSTSMKITITDLQGTAVVSTQTMTKDAVGEYHYDYTPGAAGLVGKYTITYIATDDSRVTMQRGTFNVEA